jgi:hypothetical protein
MADWIVHYVENDLPMMMVQADVGNEQPDDNECNHSLKGTADLTLNYTTKDTNVTCLPSMGRTFVCMVFTFLVVVIATMVAPSKGVRIFSWFMP